MKGKDWIEEIKTIDDVNKVRYIDAITTLLDWEMFEQEYGWTGLGMLKSLLEHE